LMNRSSPIRYTQGRCLRLRPDKLLNCRRDDLRIFHGYLDKGQYGAPPPGLLGARRACPSTGVLCTKSGWRDVLPRVRIGTPAGAMRKLGPPQELRYEVALEGRVRIDEC